MSIANYVSYIDILGFDIEAAWRKQVLVIKFAR